MDVKVYNLKSEVDAEYHFASLSLLHKLGLKVERKNYKLVYRSCFLDETTLDDLFAYFNNPWSIPCFKGHSMSEGDVMEIYSNGETKFYYVDKIDFVEIEFKEEE